MSAQQVVLLNASYEPLGKVTFQHAVRMLFREVALVEEQHGDRMIGPHPWPRVIRLVRYVAAHWLHRPPAGRATECSSATSRPVPTAAGTAPRSTTYCR